MVCLGNGRSPRWQNCGVKGGELDLRLGKGLDPITHLKGRAFEHMGFRRLTHHPCGCGCGLPGVFSDLSLLPTGRSFLISCCPCFYDRASGLVPDTPSLPGSLAPSPDLHLTPCPSLPPVSPGPSQVSPGQGQGSRSTSPQGGKEPPVVE